jgi:hypothetical protein
MTWKNGKIIIFWLLLAFYSLIFFLLLKNSFSYFDPDFGWHLKFGQETSLDGSVPRVNSINYTIPNSSLVDHEWLANFLMYWVYEHYGYFALGIIFSFLALLIFLLQLVWASRRFLKFSAALWLFLPLQFFAVFASLPSLGIRAQELTVLFLLLVLWFLDEYRQSGKRIWIVFLPPLFWLWASLHGGFMLGLGLLFIFLAFLLVEKFLSNKVFFQWLDIKEMSKINFRWLAVFVFLSAVATCLTPYGLELYSFLGSYGNNYYLKTIGEWLNQFRYPFIYRQLFFLELSLSVFLWWALSALWLKKSGAKLRIWDIFLFGLLVFMALKSRRHFPLFAVACLPLVVFLISQSFEFLKREIYFSFSKSKVIDLGLKVFLVLCLWSGAVLQAVFVRPISDPWTAFSGTFPVEGVKFFKEHPELSAKRMFNNFNWGGYFIWTLPGEKLFIDGRLPQYPFEGRSILEEYKDFYKKGRAEGMLKKHGIESVFIAAEQESPKIRWWEEKIFGVEDKEAINNKNGKNLLDAYLASSTEWQLVYRDEVSKIYIKK